jgi:hypothetical protein
MLKPDFFKKKPDFCSGSNYKCIFLKKAKRKQNFETHAVYKTTYYRDT